MTALPQALRRSALAPPRADEDGALLMDFVFPEDFPGFAGHFPGKPILPGVVQIMAAALCASGGHTTRMLELTRTKFLRIIAPGELLRVRAVPKGPGKATVSLSVGEETAATMILTFATGENEQ